MPAEFRWGLYISIPFCRFKCTYCNFASGVYRLPELEKYLEALCGEIRQFSMPLAADSVYLGGGTPSIRGRIVGWLPW